MNLDVYIFDSLAGQLSNDGGSLRFSYDAEYSRRDDAIALSVNLPLAAETFGNRESLAYFANLLPEADFRESTARALGISSGNDFALIAELGRDCAGAVVLLPSGGGAIGDHMSPRELSEDDLARELAALTEQRGFLDGHDLTRMSLAGAQTKLAVIVDGEAMALPRDWRDPTTHILKPEPQRFGHLVANEHFCMRLARACDLQVAEASAEVTTAGLPYLCVTRFDRGPLRPRRLHQEDFCQALGVLPDHKYQAEGGPTVADEVELLDRHSAVPARDKLALWRALVFNYLIGNCDAHAKNYSLLYESVKPSLAPLYDLVSTAVYDGLTERMASSIGEAKELADVARESFEEEAARCGLNVSAAIRQVDQLAAVTRSAAAGLAERDEHASPIIGEIIEGIEIRAQRVLR
ncbi:MAG: type II toxin-antitoxin system HipA family toxin [Solirubrobacterales bacterium]